MSRILLADDDTELTELLSDYLLSAEGLEVSIEQDGQVAVMQPYQVNTMWWYLIQ